MITPYIHVRNVLSTDDLNFLVECARRRLSRDGIPCYTLIDSSTSPHYLKIKRVVESHLAGQIYYLNDFYIYTTGSSVAEWHVDTEMFTFSEAINAWILLSPDCVDDPLAFMEGVNDSEAGCYHNVTIKREECIFADYFTGESESRSLAHIEANKVHTPRVATGDLLIINPKRFHKTNVSTPKHSFVIKFLLKGPGGFLSDRQIPAELWPEIEVFNRLIAASGEWEDVIEGIRQVLRTPEGRKELSAGFYPVNFDLYRQMIATL